MGNLRFKDGAGSFEPKLLCAGGVDVNTIKKSIQKVGPRDSTAIKGNGKSAYFEGAAAPLAADKIPGACFRKEKHGVPFSAASCDQTDPNGKGFCEILDLGTSKTYRGKWWVIYEKVGKKKPRICKGGILSIDEATEEDVET